MGLPLELLPTLGLLEIAVTLIYLIPRTSFLGAILMTGYLGGAIITHLIVGILAWLGLALRQPAIFQLAFGTQPRKSAA